MSLPSIYFAAIDNGMGLCRTKWALSLFDATLQGVFAGRTVEWSYISYPYPAAACNIAGNAFMRSDRDEFLLMDLDVIFKAHHLAWLLSHDVAYVGGCLPKRVLGLEYAVFPVGDDQSKLPLIDALCGRGFVKIKREVFETVQPHVPTYRDDQEKGCKGELRYEYFTSRPGGHSEDFAFCELYRSLGGETYVDNRIVLQHNGDAVYPIPGTWQTTS